MGISHNFTGAALAAGLLLIAGTASAIPARKGLLPITQPDGTELHVYLSGDEHSHLYTTADGYPLIETEGELRYAITDRMTGRVTASETLAADAGSRDAATIKMLSGIDRDAVAAEIRETRARKRAPAKAGMGLFEGASFPSKGEQKALVVLVEYTDVKVRTPDAHNYFHRMLNEEGFADNGATGSARDYFVENSKGQFQPQFDLYGPITLSQPMSYYGGNTFTGDDRHAEEMVIEACRAIDNEVDFTDYDRDGDGLIDNVFVFYAGLGENAGGGANTVWPHSADIMDLTSTPYLFDGVRLNRYACTNEWNRTETDGVGTFIHEFSHVLGLPDLYATTSSSSAFTPGSWSVLDYGPYNNNSRTPPHYSAFERYALGWIEPKVIDRACDVTMKSIADNEACIVRTEKESEYFLFENRQPESWDSYLPGHGMLVWHIDYNSSVWSRNTVNNVASHQYVDLEEADGTQSEYSRDGDSFPGAGNVTSFTDTTYPSMKTWLGKPLNLPVTDITEADGIIAFKVAGGRQVPGAPAVLPATDITPVAFTAHWEHAEDADTYLLTVESPDAEGTYSTLAGYDGLDIGAQTSHRVTGLKGSVTYRYSVTARNTAGTGANSDYMEVTTSEATFEFTSPTALPAIAGDNSFTACWNRMDGADGYILDVYSKRRGNPETAVCDFTGGLAAIPEGWHTDSRTTDSRSSYVGQAAPSLRLGDNIITSATFSDDIHSISFWHRGSSTPDENRLAVEAMNISGSWTTASETSIENAAGGKTLNVETLPAHTRAVRILHHRPSGTGTMFIDDITIKWGGDITTEPFEGYTSLNVGNVTERTVTGVKSDASYYYTVTATKGDLRSLPSNEIEVNGGNSGIDSAAADAVSEAEINVKENLVAIGGRFNSAAVFDSMGRLAGVLTSEGRIFLPSPGIYIIKIDGIPHKVAIR